MKLRVVFILLFSIALGSALSGQQKSNKKITITGFVVDAREYPVIDAIIMIDNKKTNSATDHNGFYKVKAKFSAESIGIFALILGVSEEPINGRTRINFTLADSIARQINNQNNAADEEEINIGYGTVKKQNLIGSVSKIDGTNTKYASYNSIYDILREVPGVQVMGKSIQIQGKYSINMSSEPMFVVDGMVVNSIDDIRPPWVKSIEVLKGSSASIYGSKGANGVILINLRSHTD